MWVAGPFEEQGKRRKGKSEKELIIRIMYILNFNVIQVA